MPDLARAGAGLTAGKGEKVGTFKLVGLHHVQLAMPEGREDQARTFYAGQLGLTEVPKPDELAGRGGVWFVGEDIALHLGVETPFHPARKAHPAFAVDDLDAAWREFGQPEITTLPGLRRFYIADPFSNRIEIVQPD